MTAFPPGPPPPPTPEPVSPNPADAEPADAWRHLHPLTPWFRGGVVLAALLAGALAQAQDNLADALALIRSGGVLWVGAACLGAAVLAAGYSFVWWRFARYRVGADAVELKTGILFRQQRSFRLDQLEAVDVVHPLVARLVGLAQLTLESAGGADSKLRLSYVTKADAEAIRADILHRRTLLAAGRAAAPSTVTLPAVTPSPSVTPTPGPALAGAPASTLPAAEVPLFQVPLNWTIGAYLRSPAFAGAVVLLVVAVVVIAVSLVHGGLQALASAGIVSVISFVSIVGSTFKQRLLDEANFAGYAHPDGLRLRHGLTTTVNQTIPAVRIQAVRLTQHLLWRGPDWWRLRINVAGYGLQDASKKSVLVSVATPDLAALAVGAVLPGALAPATWALVDRALHSDVRPDGFTGPDRRVRLLDPWTWRRNGYATSDFAVVIRRGWLTRTVDLVPHGRVQAITVSQGPWQRRLGAATVGCHSMPGPVDPQIAHLTEADAARFLAAEAPRTWYPARPA